MWFGEECSLESVYAERRQTMTDEQTTNEPERAEVEGQSLRKMNESEAPESTDLSDADETITDEPEVEGQRLKRPR
jgi:hypothetical protein